MSKRDTPDIAVFPPTVSAVAPALAIVLEFVLPLGLMPARWTMWSVVFGAIILVAAFWLAVSGERRFRKAQTNVDPRKPALKLVRGGPFRITRNPMYLGMVLLQLGLAFTFSLDWALVLAPVVWAILNFGVVLREEVYLTERFGDEYTAYLSRTRRWI